MAVIRLDASSQRVWIWRLTGHPLGTLRQ